jgi:hypothetical protein
MPVTIAPIDVLNGRVLPRARVHQHASLKALEAKSKHMAAEIVEKLKRHYGIFI